MTRLIEATRDIGGSLRMSFDAHRQTFDLCLDGGNLATDDGLATAVQISIFCDARIDAAEAQAQGIDDRRGYWADVFSQSGPWGSSLWAARRAGVSSETARIVEERARDALQWLVQAGAAARITTTGIAVTGRDSPYIALTVSVRRPPEIAARYGALWEATYAL